MPKGGASPIAQEDQPTYQGLLNDNSEFTAILRKVVGKTVHATIPKGNIGYDQYTVPDINIVAVENTFVAFL